MNGTPLLPSEYQERMEQLNALLRTEENPDVIITWHNTDRYALFSSFDQNSTPKWHLKLSKALLDDFRPEQIYQMLSSAGGTEYLNSLPAGTVVLLTSQGLVTLIGQK